MRNKTAQLSVDIKRTLLMVDGTSTMHEISKRVAPSLRISLDEIFKELIKNGYIEIKPNVQASPPKSPATLAPIAAKMAMPTRLFIPTLKPVDDSVNELDFAAEFSNRAVPNEPVNEAGIVQRQGVDDAKFRAEIKARVEAEFGDEIKARVEAELRAETKAYAEAEARQHVLDEANAIDEARALAEERSRTEAKKQAEAKARAEAEAIIAAKARVEAELRAEALAQEAKRAALEEARLLAEIKAKQEAEAIEKARAEAEAIAVEKIRIEAEIRATAKARVAAETERKKLEEARLFEEAKAKQEAEARILAAEKARLEAEQKAIAEAKARFEAEAKKRMEDEAQALAEVQAKQEAEAKVLEAARIRAEAELRAIAEAKLRAEAEAQVITEAKARIEAQMRTAAQARIEEENAIRKELEQARIQEQWLAENSQKQKDQLAADASEKLLQSFMDEERKRIDPQADRLSALKPVASSVDRSSSATVLFFDVVGYTKLSVNKQIEVKSQFNRLVSDCLTAQGDGERLILDTGDGAAIGFMQHPEDALQVARLFRQTLTANQHNDYPELKVRIGIHMGPVNIVKDMNGQSNMVGDAINDAQRVMGFAGTDQIFVSRAYYDFISRLSDAYADIFHYQGSQKDKHEREHHVYKLIEVAAPTFESAQPSETSESIKLDPFNFNVVDEVVKSVQRTEPKRQPPQQPSRQSPQPSPEKKKETVIFAEADKPVTAIPKRSAEEVKNLENEQAKLWADAEQNAIETAKSNTLRIVQPQDEKSYAVKRPSSARRKREPFPWGKIVVGLFLVSLATLFIAPYLFPMRSFVPKVEQLLTEKLQQPVHIGSLAGRVLPMPRLDLIDVSIGDTKQIKAQRVRANFSVLTLFSESKSISSLEFESFQIDGAALRKVSTWLKHAAADKEYPIEHILLNDGKLETSGIQLFAIGGDVNFNDMGDFNTAKLFSNGHKLFMDIDSGEKTKVSISTRANALPLLPNWVFDDFNAKGELTNNSLAISEIDAHISSGVLHGNALLDWRSGWSLEGSLSAKTIAAQSINGAIMGETAGTAHFKMHSEDLAKLTDTATMEGSLVINQGVINGIDIVETATRRRTENLPGGRTHFDELWSDFSFANGAYAFRQLKIKAGVMTAKGTLDINKQQLSGRMMVDLALRADNGVGLVSLQVGGSPDNPTLWTVR